MVRKTDLVLAAVMIITVLFAGCVNIASAGTHDGKIISAKAEPDLLVSGQLCTHVITVKNTGTVETDSELDISPLPDFLSDKFSLNAGNTKTLSINRKALFLLLIGAFLMSGGISTDSMAEVVKEGDYVQVDYIGKLEDGTVFDTSIKDVAIEAGIYNQERDYQPLGFTVAAGQMIKGFDSGVVGMAVGDDKTLMIPPEEAYGIYREDMVKTIPVAELTRAGITPVVGEKVSTSQGQTATITNVTDTDVVIDFNHELAGKTLVFDVKLLALGQHKQFVGSISISTSPSGASVSLDGNYKGVTSITLTDVPIGTYTVKLTKQGYGDVTKVISVFAGRTTYVSETLKEKTTPTPTPRPLVEAPTEAPTAAPKETPTPTPSPFASIPPLYILSAAAIIVIVLIAGIGISRKGKRGKSAKLQPSAESPKPKPEPAKQEPIIKKETPPPISEPITIERAIYDPCKRDFIERALPRMKEWINRYDLGAYWFAVSIQNNTDRAIEEWGVELGTSAALKVKDAKIEGIEIEIPHEAHLGLFKISVPKEYGIVIPKGGAQRVYFKLRAEKPKTVYEISGIFKSAITGDVSIRAKEFKYLCDAGVSPEAVKAELKKTFSEKDAARLALSFKTVQEIDRMCNQDAKTEEYQDKLSVLKSYTEGFSDKFSTHVNEFSRFMKEEQSGYLEPEYKGKVRRFCTNLVDVWISEFLKG